MDECCCLRMLYPLQTIASPHYHLHLFLKQLSTTRNTVQYSIATNTLDMNNKKGRDTNIARDRLFQTPLLRMRIALTTKQLLVLHNDFRAASNVGENAHS